MTAMPRLKGPLVLLGAGRMGQAMLNGWLKARLPPRQIIVIDPAPAPALSALAEETGLALNPPPEALGGAQVLVAAVKPQVMDEAISAIAPALGKQVPLILSIAAGRTIASFKAHFGPGSPVIRAMPNTPAAIGEGITALAASPEVTADQRELARALLSALGEVVEVDTEEMIDAVTAVSGSGPAYVFLLAECMAAAGASLGLPPQLAERLARATIAGSGALLARSGEPPAALREAVTSPGGTTAAALRVLMKGQGPTLCDLMQEAITAAATRSRQLACGK